MKSYLLIALLFTALHSDAQTYYHLYLQGSPGTVQGTDSTDAMTERIKRDAIEYAQYAPVPRLAEMDMAFGADQQEFSQLHGYGILYIPSLNNDADEYPIKRVYLRNADGITELKEIGALEIPVKDQQIIHTFGKNRIDYYYLIPYYLIQDNCDLLIDWSKNRTGFLLAKFPNNDTKLAFVKSNMLIGDVQTIDTDVLRKFMKREFNVDVELQ